jgi:hypothetical protein
LFFIFLVFTSCRSFANSYLVSGCFTYHFQLLLTSFSVASNISLLYFWLINQLLLAHQSVTSRSSVSYFWIINLLLLTRQFVVSHSSIGYFSLINLLLLSHQSIASLSSICCFSLINLLLLVHQSVAFRSSICCFSLINMLLLAHQSISSRSSIGCLSPLNQLFITRRLVDSLTYLCYTSYLYQFLLSCIIICLFLLSLQIHSLFSVAFLTWVSWYSNIAQLLHAPCSVSLTSSSVASRISLLLRIFLSIAFQTSLLLLMSFLIVSFHFQLLVASLNCFSDLPSLLIDHLSFASLTSFIRFSHLS